MDSDSVHKCSANLQMQVLSWPLFWHISDFLPLPFFLSSSRALIDDIKRSGEIWGLDGEINDWLRMTQSVAESQSAAAKEEEKKEWERDKVSRGKWALAVWECT